MGQQGFTAQLSARETRMNPFELFATLLLQAIVAGVARLTRFVFGPRGRQIAIQAWEYVQALMVVITLVTANLVFWNVVAGALGYYGYVGAARIMLLVVAWVCLPLLIVLIGGTGFAADLLINGLRKKPESKEVAKEIFRGFLGLPLWLLVLTEVMLVIGVYAPMAALAIGPLGAMGILLLSFIRKWKFTFGWEFASAIQVLFITFALLASVPSSFWRGTVGYNLRPVFSLAWSVEVNERELDAVYAEVKSARSDVAASELRAILAEIRGASRTAEGIKRAEIKLAEWERRYSSGVAEGARRMIR